MTGQARAAELGLLSRWSDLVCPLAVDRGPSEPSLCCCPCFSVFLLLSMSRTCTASAGTGSAPESRSFPGKGEHHHPGRGAVRPVSVEQAAAVWLMRPEGGMEQKQFRELPGLVDREPEVSSSHSRVRGRLETPAHTQKSLGVRVLRQRRGLKRDAYCTVLHLGRQGTRGDRGIHSSGRHACAMGVPNVLCGCATRASRLRVQEQWSLVSPWLHFTSLPSLHYHLVLGTQSHHLKPFLDSCSVVLGSLPS